MPQAGDVAKKLGFSFLVGLWEAESHAGQTPYSAETQHLKSSFVPNIPVHAGRTGQLEMAPTSQAIFLCLYS